MISKSPASKDAGDFVCALPYSYTDISGAVKIRPLHLILPPAIGEIPLKVNIPIPMEHEAHDHIVMKSGGGEEIRTLDTR
jgi:hypothetical protein